MVKYAVNISRESFVDIEGVVTVPPEAIKGASRQVEVQVRKIHCVNRANPLLPINVEDASRNEVEIERAIEAGEQLVRVNQDTRLDYRVLDLRTTANQGIFRLESEVENYLWKTLQLTFEEGIQMLKEAGIKVDPLGDLNTESERTLGRLVFEKYGTEFYILHRYPLAVRPFYTMPCSDKAAYSNSFDVFIRGEEIISRAQHVHTPELLELRAKECAIDVNTISTYIDAFRYGAPKHGGFGAGLEHVVMLLCALDNIRKTSLFPRDPRKLEP